MNTTRPIPRIRFLLIVAVTALMTGGCGDRAAPPPSAGDGSGLQEVTVVADDYAFPEAPERLRAGVVDLSFENRGSVYHEVALAGIGDTPLDQFVDDLGGGSGLEGEPFPEYVDQVAVPPFVGVEGGARGEATFTLSSGRYALFCAITDVAEGDEKAAHYELGMIREVTVSGGDAERALPEADGTITATDYRFDVDLEAGDSSVNFFNDGPDEVHLTTIELYPVGVDVAEAEEAFAAKLEPGPMPEGTPSAEAGLGFSGIFSDGLGSRFQLDGAEFESGRTYLFTCVVADRAGGEPHAIAYNMYEAITIE